MPEIICGGKPESSVTAEEKRDAFSGENVRNMFAHDGFVKDEFEYAFQFWLSLLGQYTGARLSELCQLNPQKDIKQTEGGIWYLVINRVEGKKVKTKAGVRKVPIHQPLIDIGFLEYVGKQKVKGETILFPELSNNRTDNKVYAKASRWFNDKLKKDIGIKSVARKESRGREKKDFHSFRHHFMSYCKAHKSS